MLAHLPKGVIYIGKPLSFNDDVPIAISLKYSMYTFAITEDNSDPIAKISSC